MPALVAAGTGKTVGEDPALQILLENLAYTGLGAAIKPSGGPVLAWGKSIALRAWSGVLKPPYLMAYVKLDEGVTVLTHLHAPDWDAVHIGMRMKLGFSASASGKMCRSLCPLESQT
jgi:hypothetical protein